MPNLGDIKSTRETLQDTLQKMMKEVPCSRCRDLARNYYAAIERVARVEQQYYKTEENTPEETKWGNWVAVRTKLEATVARRFMLHILERHN